jgi:hypothetical protein
MCKFLCGCAFSVPWGESEIAGFYGKSVNFERLPDSFSRVAAEFHSPTSSEQGFQFLLILPNIGYPCLFWI